MDREDISWEDYEELLSMDPESEELKEEEARIQKEYDLGEVLSAVREAQIEDFKDLKEIRREIREAIKDYKDGFTDREEIEYLYCNEMLLLYSMAKRFHPLSTFGRSMLEQAANSRKKLENMLGSPIVTRITKENISRFSALIEPDILDEIVHEKYQAIGSLRYALNGINAVGVLVYYLENRESDGELVLRIRWLYVDEDWRGEGIATSLIGEMAHIMSRFDIAAMTVDYSVDEEDALELGSLFTEWQFAFHTRITPEFACRLSDIKNNDKLMVAGQGTTALSEIGREDAFKLIHKSFEHTDYVGPLKNLSLGEDYYEPAVSCFTGTKEKPHSMVLAHKHPSGRISSEYFFFEEGKEEDFLKLVSRFAVESYYKYPKDTIIYMSIDPGEYGKKMDELFPRQMAMVLVEGVLLPPLEGMDVDTETIERWTQADEALQAGRE